MWTVCVAVGLHGERKPQNPNVPESSDACVFALMAIDVDDYIQS